MRCLSCRQENREGRKFCAECGAALEQPCPSCGASNEPGEKFCGQCGSALGGGAVAAKTPTPTPTPALPSSFADDRYRVQRLLGEGAKKRVYLAHDDRLDRDVAIAVIKSEGLDEEGLARIRREAQAMGRLGDHPNIVTVYDISEERGQPYIVSQHMAGGDVEGLLLEQAGDRLSLERALRIADNVCAALEHAHGLGVIHRDLKPGNVWLGPDGVAKLGDFGLAVALDRSRLTMAGMMVGTVAYIAPEQALGRRPDARSDLYALGAMLYEMIAGRPPFLGDDAVAIISQHINTAPVAPTWHNPDIPRALEALVVRLLAKAPEDRPEDARAVRESLAAIAESATSSAERVAPEEVNPLDRLAGGVFVGREHELDQLRAGLEDALSARGRLLFLVGEPGIGKTRTAEELATYARLRHAQVLWGRCYEGEGAPAYWPWVQVIRSYVHERDSAALLSEMGPAASDIAQVVSEVRERLPGLPDPPALEPEQARFRLFDGITTFLRNAGKAQPLVLVLDDLHWADKPSLLLLQFLARELRGARLLIIGTYRDIELGRQHPLAQMLGDLTREQLSERVVLRGLSEHDVARFIEMTAGAVPPQPLVAAVYKETEGNPFFLNEVVRLLVTDGRLEHPGDVKSWSVTIPQSVREVVGRRLDHLSQACNQALSTAAVIGRDFSIDLLDRVTELSHEQLLETLDEAVAARVVNETPRSPGRYTFAHALIRETLYEELTSTRRVLAHRKIAEALEALYGEKPDAHLAELAYHFCEAAQAGGDVHKAVDYARRAGERAMGIFAYEEAAEHFERALQALELQGTPRDDVRCGLLLNLGRARWAALDVPSSREAFARAADLARRAGSAEQLARAAVGFGGFFVGFETGLVDDELIALLSEALAALGEEDSAMTAGVMARLAEALKFAGDEDRTESLARHAVAMARRVGDRSTLSSVLTSAHWALWAPDNLRERLALIEEAIDLDEDDGTLARGDIYIWRGVGHLEGGDVTAFRRDAERTLNSAQERRSNYYLWFGRVTQATTAIFEGRLDEGEALALEALQAGGTANRNSLALYGLQLATVRYEQGRLGEMEAALKAQVTQYPTIPGWRCALALLYAEDGRDQEARLEFDGLAAHGFADIPRDMFWLASMHLLSVACARLGDVRRAELLYKLLLPHAQSFVAPISVTFGSAGFALGLLAGTLSRFDEAEGQFERAIHENTRISADPWVARTQAEFAGMLLQRGGPGDKERAFGLLDTAMETAQRIGQAGVVKQCLELKLRAQGIDTRDIKTSIDAVASVVDIDRPDLRPHAAPDGTVTIMFSDIEDSTVLTERLGDQAWQEVLRKHNALIREQLHAYDGYEVKTMGDGFMVAFQSAKKGLDCAMAIQRSFDEHNAAAGEHVRVRIGLHAGEAIKDGDDFYGKNVILASRVAGQAKGGEILVSSLLRALVESSVDSGTFGEARDVSLKGLTGQQRVFAVEWR